MLAREQELHEKDAEVSSWDFLSSALPVVEASEDDLSWFGMSLFTMHIADALVFLLPIKLIVSS